MKSAIPILLLQIFLFLGPVWAQSTPLNFEMSRHDFGVISEAGGAVCYRFSFTNSQNKPVVILDVSGGCHCTSAKFSRQPILPSRSSEIEICFDPMNQPAGPFYRKVVISTSEGRMTLAISGVITPREKSIEERYPMVLSSGLRLEENYHAFGYVEHNKKAVGSFGVINTSDRELSLQLVPSEQSGVLELDYPTIIAPKQSATIEFGYLLKQGCNVYGSLKDVLQIVVNGKKESYPLIISGIAVDALSNNTDKEWQKIQLSENFIKFGTLKQTSKPIVRSVAIRNIGLEPLIIRRIECDNSAFVPMLSADSVVMADGQSLLEVKLIVSKCDFGAVTGNVIIVTNDPQQPVKRLRVAAIVER